MESIKIVRRDSNTQRVKEGTTIFSEGDASDSMYVLEQGRVDIIKKVHLLETIEGEGMFGEMGLVNAMPRSATAIARTDCSLVVLNRGDFYFLIQHVPFFAIQVMQLLAERVRRNTDT